MDSPLKLIALVRLLTLRAGAEKETITAFLRPFEPLDRNITLESDSHCVTCAAVSSMRDRGVPGLAFSDPPKSVTPIPAVLGLFISIDDDALRSTNTLASAAVPL
jgi:hypothetical protein